jgi:hypothetical protein
MKIKDIISRGSMIVLESNSFNFACWVGSVAANCVVAVAVSLCSFLFGS